MPGTRERSRGVAILAHILAALPRRLGENVESADGISVFCANATAAPAAAVSVTETSARFRGYRSTMLKMWETPT